MALIKCPECGKDISTNSLQCINCGFPTDKIKKNNWIKTHRKIIISLCAAVVLVLGVIFALTMWKSLYHSPHTIQNPELMKLLDYNNPSQIKNDLGDDYQHNVYEAIDSSSDDYKDIEIDGKVYSQVEISYESSGEFERIYLRTDAIFTENEYKELVADLVEKYGNDYKLSEDEYEGKAIYDYTWKMSFERSVSCSFHADGDEEGKYWAVINSFHS